MAGASVDGGNDFSLEGERLSQKLKLTIFRHPPTTETESHSA